ncbi:hypothetical protein A6J71_11495 [Enterobacter cancerogenus]|uniref:UPF0509 protein YciZ n=1 Tax=Enterobacter cancerogenus TaxID=69218 RepID=A0ABX8KQM4_9ENTR|nr:hypothetical protein [Enterobacter cancerogenus]PNF10731.1 hypothetical protein A6J71_11495 [Enterobacter cancerogenus]QGG07914.1 hypothetical protein GH771_03960 [Enterobacter cancerogenus]QXA49579.1 hypothetical protein I6L58_00575 [Enterobacter cancerogenus]
MANIDVLTVAQRIDTVLDILVAGDYHSAIRNLEILKAELLAQKGTETALQNPQPKAPWEV